MECSCGLRSSLMSTNHTIQHQGIEISNTVEFRHQTTTTPVVTPENRILHGLTTITDALIDAPTAHSDAQLQFITSLRKASASWASPDDTPTPTTTIPLPSLSQICQSIIVKNMIMKHPKLQHPIYPHPSPRVSN